jgi:uncharacterized lipoprotein
MRILRKVTNLICFSFILGVSACASNNAYQQAFSENESIKGNNRLYAAPVSETWNASLAVLSRQGFTVTLSNRQDGILNAERKMTDPNDSDLAYDITTTVTIIPSGQQSSEIVLTANEQTIRYQKYHTWWHLLWMIPIFPTGTKYNTVVRHSGTVTDNKFYSAFFDGVSSELKRLRHASAVKK